MPKSFISQAEESREESISDRDAGDSKYIRVRVVGTDMAIVKYRIKKITLMSKLKKSYAERRGEPVNALRFLFDGCRILDTQTALMLQMENDDIIEVYQEQTGGY